LSSAATSPDGGVSSGSSSLSGSGWAPNWVAGARAEAARLRALLCPWPAAGGGDDDDDGSSSSAEQQARWDEEDAVVRCVPLRGVYETARLVAVEMDLMSPMDLYDRLQAHGPFEEAAAAAVGSDLLRAVAFLQRRGVAHRDVKLANLTFPHGNNKKQTVQ
jgi:serine/threonine protein kinase